MDTDRTLVSIPDCGPTSEPGGTAVSGAVEAAVAAEIAEMGSGVRPGLAAVALAMARILDNPKAVSSQPPAAKVVAVGAGEAALSGGAWAPRAVGCGAGDVDQDSTRLRAGQWPDRCLAVLQAAARTVDLASGSGYYTFDDRLARYPKSLRVG